MVLIDFHNIYFPTVGVSGDQQLFGSSKVFKISPFVFNKRMKTTKVWNEMRVNDDNIYIFGWTIALKWVIKNLPV